MKKHEFVAQVAKEAGVTQAQADKVIDAAAKAIVDACVNNDDEVTIQGLGRFKQKLNPSHEGINPLTKEKLVTKESRTLKFIPAPSVKIVSK